MSCVGDSLVKWLGVQSNSNHAILISAIPDALQHVFTDEVMSHFHSNDLLIDSVLS